MKISEMTNDQAAEALVRIAGPFGSLADDEEMMAMFDDIKAMKVKGITLQQVTAKMIPRFVTLGIRKHKRDIYEIVGALLMKSVAEVGKMNLLETIKAVQESFDETTISFFTESGGAKKRSVRSSSAVLSSTDGTVGTL